METTYPLLANRLVYIIKGGGGGSSSYLVRASETDMLPGFLSQKIDSTLQIRDNKMGVSGNIFDNFNSAVARIELTQQGLKSQFSDFSDQYQTFSSSFEQTAKGFAMAVYSQEIDKFSGEISEKYSTREQTADYIKDLVSNTTLDQYSNVISETYSTREQTATLISDQVYAAVFHPDTGVRSEMMSAINQTAAGIEMMVQEKLYGDAGIAQDFLSRINHENTLLTTAYLDAIAQNSDSIIVTFDSKITQTSSSILSEVEGQITAVRDGIETNIVSYKTSIDQQVNSITATVQSNYSELTGIIDPALIDIYNLEQSAINFETRVAVLEDGIDLSVFTNGQLNAGILIERVNLFEGAIKIAADKIQIDGSTTFAAGYNPYAVQAELAQYKTNNNAAVSSLQTNFIALDINQQALYQNLQSQGEQIVLLDGNISAVVDETGQLSSNYGILNGQVVKIQDLVSGHNRAILTINGQMTTIDTSIGTINQKILSINSSIGALNTDFNTLSNGVVEDINTLNDNLLGKINEMANRKNTRYISASSPVPPEGGFRIGDEWVKEIEVVDVESNETTYDYESYMWFGADWQPNQTTIDGARITTGIIDAQRIIATELFAQEIGAVNLHVAQGFVGGFKINNMLVAESEDGKGISIDPTKREILIKDLQEGLGISQVSIRAGDLTPEAELNASGGTGFKSSVTSNELHIRNSNGNYITSNDIRATGGVTVRQYVCSGGLNKAKLKSTVPAVSSERFVIEVSKNYVADLPYNFRIYHNLGTRNSRSHKLHGDLKVTITSRLVGRTAAGVTKELVAAAPVITNIRRSTRETTMFERPVTRKVSFYSIDCTTAYWEIDVKLEGDLTYQQWTSSLLGRYWMTSMHWGIDYRGVIPDGCTISPSMGIMEMTTSGFQFMWGSGRFFKIDGQDPAHFITSQGKWVHNGDFQLNGSDIVTIENVSSAIASDLSAYATKNYVNTGFYTKTQSNDLFALKANYFDKTTSDGRFAKKAGDGAQDFKVKNLTIHGQVNHWLAQQLVVDDARIQVNRRQDGATVDSGLVIFNKDTSSEVSSLVYDVNGIWKAGGETIASRPWVENSATAYNAARLGGFVAANYPRKAENATITGVWNFSEKIQAPNAISQLRGWQISKDGAADFRHIYTDELQAKAFTADISQALVGSDILTKSVAKLAQDFVVAASGQTSLFVDELEGFPDMQVFAVNDMLRLRVFDRGGGGLLIKDVWVKVNSYVGTAKNVQEFKVTTVVNGGVVDKPIYKGSMVLDYGTSGSGVIERTVLDAQGSPYSRVITWGRNTDGTVDVNANPWDNTKKFLHYQSGNLEGIANCSGWGVYSQNSFLTGKIVVGDLTKSNNYMEYNPVDGLTIKGKITVTGGNAATKQDIENLEIGGEQLLSGTDTGEGWNYSDFDASERVFTRVTLSTSESYISKSNVVLEPNTTYTLSAYIKSNGEVENVDYYLYTVGIVNNHNKRGISVDSEWKFHLFTFTTDADGDYSRCTVRFDNNGAKTEGVAAILYVRDIKLEKGNVATDWSRSAEDVQAEIDGISQQAQDAKITANTANSAVGSLNTYVDGAFKDGVISNAEAKAIEKYINSVNEIMAKTESSYNKVYTNTYLTGAPKSSLGSQYANLVAKKGLLISAINAAIADGKTTASEKIAVDTAFSNFNTAMSSFTNALEEANRAIQVELDNISKGYVDAVQVGGRNLLEKTNQGADGWGWSLGTSAASATVESVVESGVNTVKITRNAVENSSWSYIHYNYIGREKYKPNTEYTLSFLVKSSVNTYFPEARLQTGAAKDQIIVFARVQIQAAAGEWSRIVFKGTSAGTLPSTTNQIVYLSGMNSSPGVTYQIKDLKLELGNRATDWTLAPEDVTAEIATAKQEALTAASNAQSTANSASTPVGSLSRYVDGAFKDGVIDAAEAKAIEKYKNTLNEAMAKAESSYSKVYVNTYLSGAPKTALQNAKINLWGQRDTLIGAINTAIAGGTTTPAQKANVDSAFVSFNTLMSSFTNALEEANKAIQAKLDSLAQSYVDDIQIGGKNYIKNSELKETYKGWLYDDKIAPTLTNDGIILARTDVVNPVRGFFSQYIPNEFDLGDKIVLSGYLKLESGTINAKTHLYVRFFDSSGANVQDINVSLSSLTSTEERFVAYGTISHSSIDFSKDIQVAVAIPAGVTSIRVRNLQLERGTKVTDWRANENDSFAAVEYISKAMAPGTTTDVIGGLVATNVLLMKDTNGTQTGGLSGLADDNVGFWTGGTYQQALEDLAKVIIRKDGSGQLAGGLIKMTQDGDVTIGDVHVDGGGALIVKEGAKNRVFITKDDITTLDAIADSTQNTTVNNSDFSTMISNLGSCSYNQPLPIIVNNNGTRLTVTGLFGLSLNTRAGFRLSQASIDASMYLRQEGGARGSGIYLASGSVTVNKTSGEAMTDSFNNRSFNKVAYVSAGKYYIVMDLSYKATGPAGEPNEEAYYNANAFINASTMHALYDGAYQRNEIGKNGIGVIFNANNYSFFGVENGNYKAVEKVSNSAYYDKPGLLLSGIKWASGSVNFYFGSYGRGGSLKSGSDEYQINHAIGHTDYTVILTPIVTYRQWWVTEKASTYFRIKMNSTIDTQCEFAVFGNNK